MNEPVVLENRHSYKYKKILQVVDDATRLWLLYNIGDENMNIIDFEPVFFKDGDNIRVVQIAVFNDSATTLSIRKSDGELGLLASIPGTRLGNINIFKPCSTEILEKIKPLLC